MSDTNTHIPLLNAEQLARLGDGLAPPACLRLDVSLPLAADERSMWERRLNRFLKSCGCAEGAIGLFVGVAIVVLAYLVGDQTWSRRKVIAAVVLPLALFAGGKWVGRWLDRRRFRQECRRLSSRLGVEIAQRGPHE